MATTLAERIVDFALSTRYEDLPGSVGEEARRRIRQAEDDVADVRRLRTRVSTQLETLRVALGDLPSVDAFPDEQYSDGRPSLRREAESGRSDGEGHGPTPQAPRQEAPREEAVQPHGARPHGSQPNGSQPNGSQPHDTPRRTNPAIPADETDGADPAQNGSDRTAAVSRS